MEKYGIGKRFVTNEGYEIEVINKFENDRRIVRFENGHEVKTICSIIRAGKIANPYHKSVVGVGYFGVGEYKASIHLKETPEYRVWVDMIRRCYSKKLQEKFPTYEGVEVCTEWLNFQNFAKWYNDNFIKIDNIKLCLDKDLLQREVENKIYSPDTCVFLPEKINTFLSNKQSSNTSGFIGVSWKDSHKKWRARINLFGEYKNKTLGYFDSLTLASESYQRARAEQSELAKQYLRDLNYLSENIIQCIK